MTKKLTRRSFIKTTATGVAGAALYSTLTGCQSLSGSKSAAKGPIKFLSVSDMHITTEKSTDYPRKVIQAMNQEKAELVLAVGDMGSKPTREELELGRDVLDQLTVPYYPVVGNHDSPRYGVEETMFLEVFSLKESSYSFAHRGILFLGIDHGCGPRYKKNAVRPKHMAFIKETLANTPVDQPIVFFSHYPFATGVNWL